MNCRKTVLLAYEEGDFRCNIAAHLEVLGFCVTTLAVGDDLMTSFNEIAADVLLVQDALFTEKAELLKELCASHPETRIIFVTRHGSPEQADWALQCGVFDYLVMPCETDILIARIQDAVALPCVCNGQERTVADIMIPIASYVSVQMDATVLDGIRKIRESHENLLSLGLMIVSGHRAVLVFDAEELVGVLSMRNLIETIRPDYFGKNRDSFASCLEYSPLFWNGLLSSQIKRLGTMQVGQIMNPCPPIVDEKTNLMHAANLLYLENRRRIAVAKNGRIVGVVREQELFYEISRLMLDETR